MQGKWLVGIDEVGRGPLAGPVGVGVVKISEGFDWSLLPPVGDSKVIKEKHRDEVFKVASALRKQGALDFQVELVPASYIDKNGIVHALRYGMNRAIKALKLSPQQCFIKLDGALAAPPEFEQLTIIKGDASEPVIGLASIVAKVTRDRFMERLHSKYPEYDFKSHKGYGTPAHRRVITMYGLSPVHRASYCQNILSEGTV